MNANTLVRSIVRERVRRHFGMLSEAVQKNSQTNNDGITVELGLGSTPQEDTFVVSNAGPGTLTAIRVFEYADGKKVGEDLYNYNAERAGEDALVLQPGQNWSYDGTSINLRENVNLRVSYTVVDDKGGTQTRKLDFPMGARAAAAEAAPAAPESPAAPAAPEVAAAGAGTSTAPGVLGVGAFGEYSVDVDRLVLLPRDTYESGSKGMLSVEDDKKKDKIATQQGISVELLQGYDPSKAYFISLGDYKEGDLFDVVSGGKVFTRMNTAPAGKEAVIQDVTPDPLDPAVREIESGGPSAEPEGGATSGETKPTYMPKEGEPGSDMEKLDPQLAAGDVQQKIRNVGVAVKDRAFSDITEEGIISVDDVAAENSLAGHTWITNSENDRAKFKLDNWSDKWGDPYTYFALVNNETEKPIAFVVASDPQDNNHFSTGRFIGPDSKRPNLRRAFCYLYHRATGEVHETCVDGPTAGPDDDRPKGSGGGGKGKGKGGGAGTGTGSGGGREDDTYKKGKGPGAIKLVSKDGHAVRGKGDIMTGIAGIGLRPAEKLRGAGRKIITKSKDNRGFSSFPKGPGNKFLRNPISAGGGKIPPSALGVFFQHPMAIITDAEGANPYINFGKNTSPENILKIRMGWGAFGRIGLRGALTAGLTLKPGDDGFDEAAAWILSHQEEFDLRPDGFVIEDPMDVKDVSPDENRGASLGERAINEARRTRSLTPLFDRYRF